MPANKVYVVWYDNGEPWGDNFSDIEAIFATREDAEKYLNKYYVRDEISKSKWQHDKTIGDYTCRCGFKKCDGEDNLCPVYEKWEDDGYLTIQNLGHVVNACCGHGTHEGYIMFDDGTIISGNFTVIRKDSEKGYVQ